MKRLLVMLALLLPIAARAGEVEDSAGRTVTVPDRIERVFAVILSTHDPDHALNCAHEVALPDGGRLVATGAPEAMLTAEKLSEVYGVEVTVERLSGGQLVCVPVFALP